MMTRCRRPFVAVAVVPITVTSPFLLLLFKWRRHSDCRFQDPPERTSEPRPGRFDTLGDLHRYGIPTMSIPSAGSAGGSDPVQVVVGRLERARQEREVERMCRVW